LAPRAAEPDQPPAPGEKPGEEPAPF
jgi:hypothetical protein